MNEDEACAAVATQAEVVARYTNGMEHGRGRVISYSLVPTVTIERPDGSRFSWRHDMATRADAEVAR